MTVKYVEDVHVLEAMSRHGGGFIKALAEAGFRADSANLDRLKAAWPEKWAAYKLLAVMDAAKAEQRPPEMNDVPPATSNEGGPL